MGEMEKMVEMGIRGKKDLRGHRERWALRVLRVSKASQVPKENPVPRSLVRKTGNNAHGKILMMGETMD